MQKHNRMPLAGKKIILAITGSIAAYKTPQLVRLLVKEGAEVKVITTDAAQDFVSPLVLSTLSKHPVYSSVRNGSQWHNHVMLGRWADVMLIAPASANSLAKLANGICDNMVQAVYLSANCPVVIAPAMDEDMWLHPATQANIDKLKQYNNAIIPVGYGELASGLVGPGRMAEPEEIVHFLDNYFIQNETTITSTGKKALITAGPTYEAIDPVRFIGNHSTGKMGIAIANALAAKGIAVTLVLGPSHQEINHPLIKVIPVMSADQMFEACLGEFEQVDIAIMAAAVADFKPITIANEKIKKSGDEQIQITLVKNKDILAHLGSIKQPEQTLVGFALETNNEMEHAQQKLIKKNADMIVLNSLKDEGAGFGYDTNKVSILFKDGRVVPLALQSKTDIAKNIVACILAEKEKDA